MTETTNPTSLKSLIEEEHRTARRAGCVPWFDNTLTEEQRREREIRETWRYRLQSAIHTLCRETLRLRPSPKYLLALPFKLANNDTFGTNAVMRAIVSDSVCAERIAHLEELFSDLWPTSMAFMPGPEDVFGYFDRVQGRVDDLKSCTLAECYWLMEISKWAYCFLSDSGQEIEKAFAVKDSVNELDFTRVLDRHALGEDRPTLEAAFKQYEALEKVLRRF